MPISRDCTPCLPSPALPSFSSTAAICKIPYFVTAFIFIECWGSLSGSPHEFPSRLRHRRHRTGELTHCLRPSLRRPHRRRHRRPGLLRRPCASLRGDFGRLILEAGANLQDTCVMHGFPGTDTGGRSRRPHRLRAVLTAAASAGTPLIGMNAGHHGQCRNRRIVIVAASAFVKAGAEIPARSLAAGMPYKVLRAPRTRKSPGRWRAPAPIGSHPRCLVHPGRGTPLSAVEPDRPRIAPTRRGAAGRIEEDRT